MSFAPPTSRYDVGFEMKDGTVRWVARSVERFDVESYAYHPSKPAGAKFVCKLLMK